MSRILRSTAPEERTVRLPTGPRPEAAPEPPPGPQAATEHGEAGEQAGTAPANAGPAADRADIETLRHEAFEQGHDQGYREGLARAEEETREAVARLARVAEAAADSRGEALFSLQDAVAELTYEAVIQLLGRAMADEAGVVAVVRQVLDRAGARKDKLTLRVSPRDYETLKSHEAVLAESTNAREIALEPDSRVSLGGCLMETPRGNLDGRLEMQLQRLRDMLLEARESSE